MSNEIIIQHLKDKEVQLLNELNKVRIALQAFIDGNVSFISSNHAGRDELNIPSEFKSSLTYGSKVLYILAKERRPMLVDEITMALHNLEPEVDVNKLHKNISYNLSMLAKYSKVKKHAFNRKMKYSV